MLTHDQNEVKTDLTEQDLKDGEDTMSKAEATEQVAAETEPEDQTQAEPVETPEPEPTEEPVSEEIPEEPASLEEPREEEFTVLEPEPEPVAEEPMAEPEPELVAEEPVAEPEPESLFREEEPAAPAAWEPEPVAVEPMEEPAPQPEPEPKVELTQEELEREAMLSMIDEYTSSFQVGEIKEGTVVGVTDREVSVAIGFKSDGVIPISEFAYSGIPELNSTIKVFISSLDNGEGRLSLSKKKADFIVNIERIKEASSTGDVLPGIIRRRVKGGMIVDVLGIEAFLPGSQMSLKPIPNLDQFIGKELSFKVMSIDEEHRNIILSRKLVLEEEANEKRQELLSKIQIDSELDGEVKNITQYGAFIDLGGIDGLLHLTDMSWGKIGHPSEMLAIGDKVKVKVINFDPETNKISLGLKQLVPHPWETIEIKYPEGTRVTGKVVSVKSFGAFVEIEPGVEGLVHISEMSWTKKISDARKILKVGDTINAIVLDLDKENKRISLGMKQMDPNPWLTIEDRYPIGTVLVRKVKSLTAFGAFVEIEEGIDGLIHISDISWTKRIYHPREVYRKGQEVETVILSIDRALHRIALGVKQLSPDPWEKLNELLPVNTEVKGKISKLIPKGVLVDVPIGEDVVEGFIPISHLAIPKLEHSEEAFHIGEEIPLKVIELDMDNRRLILSVKAFFFSRDPRLQEEYIAIHEQFMRERIAKLTRKKAEKTREKARTREERAGQPEVQLQEGETMVPVSDEPVEEHHEPEALEAPAETGLEAAPILEEEITAPEPVEEQPVELEPVPEPVAEPVEEPVPSLDEVEEPEPLPVIAEAPEPVAEPVEEPEPEAVASLDQEEESVSPEPELPGELPPDPEPIPEQEPATEEDKPELA
jgi:small subunit ribosomal protein S1